MMLDSKSNREKVINRDFRYELKLMITHYVASVWRFYNIRLANTDNIHNWNFQSSIQCVWFNVDELNILSESICIPVTGGSVNESILFFHIETLTYH